MLTPTLSIGDHRAWRGIPARVSRSVVSRIGLSPDALLKESAGMAKARSSERLASMRHSRFEVSETVTRPHDEIVYSPAMGVNELPLRRMCEELINQCATFMLRHAKDSVCV
jgi:hypothetical protein